MGVQVPPSLHVFTVFKKYTRKHPANKKLLLEIATERFHEFESRTSILTRMLVEWLNTAIGEQNVSVNFFEPLVNFLIKSIHFLKVCDIYYKR